MESHIIYLKNRFYKIDGARALATQSPQELWEESLIYDSIAQAWNTSLPEADATKLFSDLNEKKWIRIIKMDGYFKHEGPYSDLEIFEMLKKSQIMFKDPVWKKGLTKWTALRNIETFKSLSDSPDHSSEGHESAADLLDSVIEMRRVEFEIPSNFIEVLEGGNQEDLLSVTNIDLGEQGESKTDIKEDIKIADRNERMSDIVVLKADKSESHYLEKLFLSLGVLLLVLYAFLKWGV